MAIELVDKYTTGRFDKLPPNPAPCFIASITIWKKLPEESTKDPIATAAIFTNTRTPDEHFSSFWASRICIAA